jgi:2-keto-4-pentenoate hydratase/2-oxohepta-3-ene-1,7-dioic acid hydratase in catechol pathway
VLGSHEITDETVDVKQILAPIVPTAIFCIGLNYRKHAEEAGAPIPAFPILFMKGPAAVQNPGGPIVLPTRLKSTEVDYEAELAVVIGRRCKNVSRKNALDYVFGYTASNDVSARDWQMKWGGSQWCRGKTFDTFAPLGPVLVTAGEIPNPNTLRLRTILNGNVMQDSNTSDMIFDVSAIIEFLSGSTTLLPGTVILTGTPSGVGGSMKPPRFLKAGDSITVEIERIGSLTNPVLEESLTQENS